MNSKKPVVKVMMGDKQIPFTMYQLINAKFCLQMFKVGMKVRHVTLKDIRLSLSLKGKTTIDCLAEVEERIADYNKTITPLLNTSEQ